MKIHIAITVLLSIISVSDASAQLYNWSVMGERCQAVSFQTGLDNGIIFGAAYGYRLPGRLPIIVSGEYSFPAGSSVADDHKVKAGVQARLLKAGSLRLSGELYGLYRRFNNDLTGMVNFGSYSAISIGWYRPGFFVAGQFGFDKAIVTHFRHHDSYRELFPDVQDGWYQPATGGNYSYGIAAGYSLARVDMNLRAGKAIAEDFKTRPFVPFYAVLGCNLRFGKKME